MSERRPLVLVGGEVKQLPAGDTLPGGVSELYALASSRSGKDASSIYTTVEFKRADNTLARKSVLSGGTTPEYTTRTETLYATDGTTVTQTLVFTLTYTAGELTAEDLA